MNRTGICPRETSLSRPAAPACRSFSMKARGLAMAGLLLGLGTAAMAMDYDPNLPRTEEVLDTDGSVWQVLIVPRPLYRPGVPNHPAMWGTSPHGQHESILPPAPSEEAAPPKTYEEQPQEVPAPAEKTTDEQVAAQEAEAEAEEAPAEENAEEPAKAEEPKKEPIVLDNAHGVEIVPRFSYPILPPSAACLPSAGGAACVNPWNYALIYDSIPFLRSEYIANPSYRHEATMEILFGQLRPTVVHKHPGQPRPHETLFPYENDIIRPYSYYSMGPGAGYGRGPLPFGAPGAYGVNYNFYWPMPTIYRNY